MKKELLNFLSALGMTGVDPDRLERLCTLVCGELNSMLAEGVRPEDCAEAYIQAAALMVVEWLDISNGLEGVTFLSAGDLTVRRDSGGRSRFQRVKEIMRPWLKDRGFAFVGVRG